MMSVVGCVAARWSNATVRSSAKSVASRATVATHSPLGIETDSVMRIMDVSAAQKSILRRAAWDELAVPEPVMARSETIFGERLTPDEAVRRILADVRARGDAAVREWTRRLDGVESELVVSRQQIEAAYGQVAPEVVAALRLAAERVEAFHRRQPSL